MNQVGEPGSGSEPGSRVSKLMNQVQKPNLVRARTWFLRANERLVLDAVRLERIGPAGLSDPLGVLRPVALEPRHLRVAFEREDVRRDAVEEPAIMRDHHGAAREVEQRILERAERVDVEVV